VCEPKDVPRRPAIPSSLVALVLVIVLMRCQLYEGQPWLEGASGRVSALIALACIVATLMCAFARHNDAALTCALWGLCCCVALTLTSFTLEHLAKAGEALAHTSVSSLAMRTTDYPLRLEEGRYRCRAQVEDVDGMTCEVWLMSPDEVPCGAHICGVGVFEPPSDDAWGTSLRMCGMAGTIRLARVEIVQPPPPLLSTAAQLRRTVLAAFAPQSSPERALLAGCICGDRSALREQGIQDLFSRCGVAHLVAVSGGHLMVVCELLGYALEACGMRVRYRTLLLFCASGAFVVICGLPVSAVRAWLMYVLARLGALVGRRSHSLSSVSLVALAMALTHPGVTGELGYVLSVVSVCGLCMLSGYARYAIDVVLGKRRFSWVRIRRIRSWLYRLSEATRASLATSLVALLVTLPLTAETFGQVSLVGPLANVAMGALFTPFLCVGIMAAVSTLFPLLQGMLLAICDVMGAAIISFLKLLEQLPCTNVTIMGSASFHVLAFVALAVLLLWWPKLHRRWVLGGLGIGVSIVVALVVRWRWFAEPRICVLDVGQGDAILVQDGSHALLVDAGPDDSVVYGLARNHVLALDAVLVTHLHDDHYGGISSLAGAVPCQEVYVAKGVAEDADDLLAKELQEICGHGTEELSYGDVLQIGRFDLEVVWPRGEVDGSENAHSLELYVSYKEEGETLCGLLTGDAESKELEQLISAGDIGDIDFLKVGHHGSSVSLTPEQARCIDAEVAIASAGEGNIYGHPTPECIEALESSGSLFLCTKDVGDIEVWPGKEGARVSYGEPLPAL